MRFLFILFLFVSSQAQAHSFPEIYRFVSPGVLVVFGETEDNVGFELTAGASHKVFFYGGTFKSFHKTNTLGLFLNFLGMDVEVGAMQDTERKRTAGYGSLGFSVGVFEVQYMKPTEPGGDVALMGFKFPFVETDEGKSRSFQSLFSLLF